MPTRGLSLVGFMDQGGAIQHLRNTCMPSDPGDPALIQEWNTARARISTPTANAGNPQILDIPPQHAGYMAQLQSQQWLAQSLAQLPGAAFKMIEIDPLLAFQFHVDVQRSEHHCKALVNPPSIEQTLRACLPINPPGDPVQQHVQQQSAMIKSRSLNLRMADRGIMMHFNAMGFQFIVSLPVVHVVRFNGLCYLHNGYHRAYGVRAAGGTHVPCLFRDVPTPEAVGINPMGGTFQLPLLESSNPPTMAHFTQGAAHPVQLRAMSRVLHVSWAEYVVADE